MATVSTTIQIDSALKEEQPIYNKEPRKAIEDARRGIGLTQAYHSAAELFAALDAETRESI